jgi:hypothetical protein
MADKKEEKCVLQKAPRISYSDIYIDREGSWFYRGTEMIRHDIVRLFYQNLILDEKSGYFIRIGQQSYPVRVEDTAYIVQSVRYSKEENSKEECIYILLSDNRIERLDPGTVRIGKNDILYCRVREGRFEARFSKPAYYQLAEHINYNSELDSFYLLLNDRFYYIKNAARCTLHV